MSLLIQMRQRMQAIETIKKITHAMRLISMSSHSRLRGKQEHIEHYKKTIHQLFSMVHAQHKHWQHDVMMPSKKEAPPLFIIIGSQKGLCGNFNQSLYFHFEKFLGSLKNRTDIKIITVGRKIAQLTKISYGEVIAEFEEFSFANLETIAHDITTKIFEQPIPFSSVTIYNNYPKSFFSQKAKKSFVIPFVPNHDNQARQDVLFSQPPEEILNELAKQLIGMSIQEALFESLVAEHAARFIAMDSSTRNASKLLEAMQLDYNKLRQTKITRELTDLAGSFF